MEISGRRIGAGCPVYIVAELSANHRHNIDTAKATIKMAHDAGADAVKLQTYTPDTITIDCDNEYFQVKQGTIWDGVTLYDLYKTAYTPYEWHGELFEYARDIGITIFSTPFDFTAVDLLEENDTPAYKIASFEINDIPLIEYVAEKKKTMILSTGIATPREIEEALAACRRVGNDEIVLLQCTSAYPTPMSHVNLRTMSDLRGRFGVVAGLSDHTMGNEVSIAAAALGAAMIERHVILDRSLGGPDAVFSLDADQFKRLVFEIRNVESALGRVTYELSEGQKKSKEHSRSLFVVEDMRAGDIITAANVRSIRPGFGMHPRHYTEILGKKVNVDLKRGTPMEFEYIE